MTKEKVIEIIKDKRKMMAYGIARFKHFGMARDYASRCIKLHMIILGDDEHFWVCTPAISECLFKLGYEYAE